MANLKSRNLRSRRGQKSISDDNYHVTEAIGDMYDEDGYDTPSNATTTTTSRSSPPVLPPIRTVSNDRIYPPANMNGSSPSLSPLPQNRPPPSPRLNRTNSNSTDTATSHFPLNDIDYESSPAAVAQELSNLQAIRRMSMDVNSMDPDLPSFGSGLSIPSSPTHSSEDDDPSRLFWVPARLHPELAPKEFKTFIEDRVKTIRRSSLSDEATMGPEGLAPPSPGSIGGGGLRRKKSMLSRQINNAHGYQDGSERLERKRSQSGRIPPDQGGVQLEELENLVNDPSGMVRRMSMDAEKQMGAGGEVPSAEDMPILPPKPAGGLGLKRSTRTNYRRGSLRKGERVPFSQRPVRRLEPEPEERSISPTSLGPGEENEFTLSRVQTDPLPAQPRQVENFSRPGRRRTPEPAPGSQMDSAQREPEQREPDRPGTAPHTTTPPKSFHSRIGSNGRTTAQLPGYPQPVPQIIETPPPSEPAHPPRSASLQARPHPDRRTSPEPQQQIQSPQTYQPTRPPTQPPQQPLPRAPMVNRTPPSRQSPQRGQQGRQPEQTLDQYASHPSPLPGSQYSRTDAMTFIPTMQQEEKKSDKKSKDKKDVDGSRKTSSGWGWLLGGEDKAKAEREKEEAKKPKSRLSKGQDNTRLDVLQTSIDGGKPRESLVLGEKDRESLKLEEARSKEGNRKTSTEAKKEKESGIFSSLFGGSKKKGEKEHASKKSSSMRGLSPDPTPRILVPDKDYNWSRFSILEERAIYRMAHIKLANPRRELYSQVLLSNFMYSYLAKVQQMHPQIQIPQSAAQKQQQRQQAQQQKKMQEQQQQTQHHQPQQHHPNQNQQQQHHQQAQGQPEEYTQYQRYQESNRTNPSISFDNLSTEPPGMEDDRPDSRASQHSHHSNGNAYTVASGHTYLGTGGGHGGGGGGGKHHQQQAPYLTLGGEQGDKRDSLW